MGYAIGALLAGIITDLVGAAYAIAAIGVLTFASGTIVALVMDRSRQNPSS
jgi:predicted MFS family arabinose efflux permease